MSSRSQRIEVNATDLVDISEAAQFLNVSEASLRRRTNAGTLPFAIYIRVSTLEVVR
jgi:hypothetical protein